MKKAKQNITTLLLFFGVFLLTQHTYSQSQTFNTSSTFTVPAGVTTLNIQAWGGGGAGGAARNNNSAGGGGAGGGYVRNTALAVVPGTTYTVTVGTGGIGVNNNTIVNGNPSWFGTTGTLLAVGGNGGNPSSSNNFTAAGALAVNSGNVGATPPLSYYGGAGGTGATGGASAGGGGSSAGTGSNGNAGNVTVGGVAVAGGGAGVNGTNSDANGADNSNLGGGGAGARSSTGTDRTGGDGGNGRIIISWTCPTYGLTSTTAVTPICRNNNGVVTVNSTAAALPVGTYTVTYNLSAPNAATGSTATMTVTVAGTGTFNTSNLATAGATTVTITNISSGGGNCFNNSLSNNIVVITTNAAVPAQPSTIAGNASVCQATSVSYSVTNVAGTSYAWTFPSGWNQTGGGTSNSITVTVGSGSGNIQVVPSNGCGNGTARTLAVTTTATFPAQPSTITGSATVCQGATNVAYSVTNVAGTTYTWLLPSGWVQTGGGTTNSITVTVGAGSGDIRVTPSNVCGTGTSRTLAVITSASVAPTSAITGPASVCPNISINYSVVNVPGVTYTWSFPAGWVQTAGGNSNAVTVTTSGNVGNVRVTPSNACGAALSTNLTVTAAAIPTITSTTPGSRTGPGTVNLAATASAGTISWYANSLGGVALGTGGTFVTPVLAITTVFYVETVNGSCVSPRVGVIATVNVSEIVITGNSINIEDEDTTPETTDFTDFGTVNIPASLTRTFTIQNIGGDNLTLGAITIGGADAAQFVVLTNPVSPVAPSGSTTFSIRFTPASLGVKNATFSMITNDVDENPFNFSIRGTGGNGLVPEINLRGNSNDIPDNSYGADPNNHTDFGSPTLPTPVTRIFTIQNTGTGPLTLTGVPFVTVTGSSTFTVIQPLSGTIAAGGSINFSVVFTPTIAGIFTGVVTINNNDSDESVYDFVIRATALVSGREIEVQGNETIILDGDTTPIAADQTDFGVTDTTTPIQMVFDVYSLGTGNLTFGSPRISVTNPTYFTVTALPSGLNSGLITAFVVTFTPNGVTGIQTATITINNDDNTLPAGENVFTFAVQCEIRNLAALTVAPGGVTGNLRFWLKANSQIGVNADNTALTTWTDQTYGNTKNAITKATREPRFKNNVTDNVNFNPVVSFDGLQSMYGQQGFYNADMYIVVRPRNTMTAFTNSIEIYNGDDVAVNKSSQDITGFSLGSQTGRFGASNELVSYCQATAASYGAAEISNTKSYSGVQIFNPRRKPAPATTGMEILNNGNVLTTLEVNGLSYKNINNTRYWLGRSETFDASLIGDLLEIINFDTRKSDADRTKVETYLAIKYGITLGVQGTSKDYVNSNNTVIYSGNAAYNFRIAGIGRDDNSGLNQKQSKTEFTNNDITVGLGDIFARNSDNTNTFASDRDFLVWGSNNGTIAAQPPILVNMSSGVAGLTTQVDFVPIGRTWRLVETGSVGRVKVSIPSTLLTNVLTPPGDFLMFVSNDPVFSANADYSIMRFNGANLETTYDFNGIKYVTFGYAPERTFVRSIDFDGINDYLDAGNVINLNTSFTVSAWIKRTGGNNNTILSKRPQPFSSGYELGLTGSGSVQMRWMNGTMQTITSSVSIPAEVWHNIAVTYNGTTASLYIDGVLDSSTNLAPPVADANSFLIGAANGASPTAFFDGTIDEVRVWDIALSVDELRYIMNQELLKHVDSNVNGSIVPQTITKNEVKAIPWNRLRAYYPMSTFTYTNAKDRSDNNYYASLRNLTTVDFQTAPMPYVTTSNGNWASKSVWTNGSLINVPSSLSIVDNTTIVGWNIVRSNHNIESGSNTELLSLDIQSNKFTAKNDSKIEVSHYLNLNGVIDLQDMSQLVQTQGSDLNPTSTGYIERDQQGTRNLYNYNYWSSPVSTINNSVINNGYTVNSVMKNGTTSTFQNINWTDELEGQLSPFTLSRYWIYKYQNLASDYANWSWIGETGALGAGQGFTLKGCDAPGTQNYTFVGKPNNGTIPIPIAPDNLSLIGNPYPSAISVFNFINDNLSILDTSSGLYFWEHSSTNVTHVYSEYQGGYATVNLVGGIPPVALAGIDGLGNAAKTPGPFIPVGQGFFVEASAAGGNIEFRNSQRAFVRETDVDNFNQPLSNTMFRNAAASPPINTSAVTVAGDPSANFKTVTLGFNSYDHYQRTLLLGFTGEYADDDLNPGYDAANFDDNPSDMYFIAGDTNLIIQGVGEFATTNIYPLGVKTNATDTVQFLLKDTRNLPDDQAVFIHDAVTDQYHNLRDGIFEIILEAGTYNDRFSLRFANQTLGVTPIIQDAIIVVYANATNRLTIQNDLSDTNVESVSLFNIIGQQINIWDITPKDQKRIEIPISNLSAGTYIVRVKTDKGNVVKKIIIK